VPSAVGARGAAVRILALPRNSNPYQELLYGEIRRAGHDVRYAGQLTPSHTLNLLLLPLEISVCRALGWRVLHLHWVFAFQIPGSNRLPWLRKVAQAWFALLLCVGRRLGMHVVWTAHNVLPHERVFHDDEAARRLLVRSSDLVLAHSAATFDALESIGAAPARGALVPMGPFDPRAATSSALLPTGGQLSLLFFGQVIEYKGVEELLAALSLVASSVSIRLLIAGECRDTDLRDRLRLLAERCGERVQLRLERIPEDEVGSLMARAHVVVLPFRRGAGMSSSALLAMGHGRTVVLPDLPAFSDLPRDCAVFYDGSVVGLERVITEIASWSPERLQECGAAARAHIGLSSWADAAQRTIVAIEAAR
jgi:glycosyltransferase involved in cell wall biosynthesis